MTHFLNWMKNTLLYTYRTNILVHLLTANEELSCPQNSENVLPHSISSIENAASQSSRENVTPSSDTSPFASPPLGISAYFVE